MIIFATAKKTLKMELSEYAIQQLTPFVTGDNGLCLYRKATELVILFNKYGQRDVYDSRNGGLPKLSKGQTLNTTRKEYTKDRLRKLSGTDHIRPLLEEVLNDSQNKDDCVREMKSILEPEKFTIQEADGKYTIIGGVVVQNNEIRNDAAFQGIQTLILAELDKAQVSIILAMAWFTNQVLADKLKEKAKQDIWVEIIIYDDGVNARHGVDLSGLDVKFVKGTRGGIMHDKFCVIDNQVVLHGSYNWSCNAEYRNDETVQVSQDPKLSTKFSVEFRKLRKSSMPK